MKILWVCNVALPSIASKIGIPVSHSGGWMVSMAADLCKRTDIDLGIAFPIAKARNNTILTGQIDNIHYYGFPCTTVQSTYYDDQTEMYFQRIMDLATPDIVHIFGTEFPHTLAMIRTGQNRLRTIISIQGLCSVYSYHYNMGVPIRYQRFYTLRDFLRQDNINQQRKKFMKRGQYEIQAISQVHHVIGRTDWDKACVLQINPTVQYHFCNESLRDIFYHARWSLDKCRRHSIFISQSYYPIKGFHLFLEALPHIIQKFPDTHIFTTGKDFIHTNSLKDILQLSSYQFMIRNIVKRNHLEPYITFLGELNESQICQAYLNAHVFVLPSTIENSPNSLGEAMLLGLPCISSHVGGVANMLVHGVEGFLYPSDEPYMISYYVCKLFENDNLARRFSEAAHLHALETHDRKNNLQQLLNIYEEVVNE